MFTKFGKITHKNKCLYLLLLLSLNSCSLLPRTVTKEEFNLIREGMTYGEVVDIIGEEYSDVNDEAWGVGVPTIYMWENLDGSKVFITMYYSSTVASKHQVGL